MQEFYKYHGAGNDFVLIDNRTKSFEIDNNRIREICDRRLGVGADGLILLNVAGSEGVDFEMQYFNSDGFEGSMCGNGGRCIVAFAKYLQIIGDKTTFAGVDGLHHATVISSAGNKSKICIQMKDVREIKSFEDGFFLDTGSPHMVKFVESVHDINVPEEGRNIRYDSRFADGTNVNFVEVQDGNTIFVRTFERGVEDETLSCGTGVTASALVFAGQKDGRQDILVNTRGGTFRVRFDRNKNNFFNIYLQGETCFVFKGYLA